MRFWNIVDLWLAKPEVDLIFSLVAIILLISEWWAIRRGSR